MPIKFWLYHMHQNSPPRPPADKGPHRIFLYGALADPNIFKATFGLQTLPTWKRARIDNYVVKMWGDLPVIVTADRGRVIAMGSNIVEGTAYEIHSEDQLLSIEVYLGDKFKLWPTGIIVEGGGDLMPGWIFKWDGSEDELKDEYIGAMRHDLINVMQDLIELKYHV